MFTVFGASGNTGSIVAASLLSAGKQVRAGRRDQADKLGATEWLIGDVADATSWRRRSREPKAHIC